jgi:hypothetical protein
MATTIRNTAYFIAAVRQLSNTENDPIVTDPEINDRCNEALSELYDIIIGSYEHYAVCTFSFSLSGGLGGNTVALPSCFYKDVSLDYNPNIQPQTVHRFTSLVDRNSQPRRSYICEGNYLVVQPYQFARGDYLLTFSPLPPVMAPSVAIDMTTGSAAVDGTLKSWFFSTATFSDSDVGSVLVISGASTPGNNGSFTITAVSDPNTVITAGATTLGSEAFTALVTASYHPANTIDVLPQIFVPWYEYIQVHAAIAVKDKIEQDTSSLQVRLERLVARITAAASNRMEEGGQIAIPRQDGGFWDLSNYPGGV